MDKGEFLANTLLMATEGAVRSIAHVIELETQIEEFRPRISSATEPVLTTFLQNSNSAAQMAFDISALLTLKIDLSERIEKASNLHRDDKNPMSDSFGAIIDYYEFSLLILTTFQTTFELYNLLAGLADKSKPPKVEFAKEFMNLAIKQFTRLCEKMTGADELKEAEAFYKDVKEAWEISEEIKKSANRLESSKIKITLQNLVGFEKENTNFLKAAQSIARLRDVQILHFKRAKDLAERLNTSTNG